MSGSKPIPVYIDYGTKWFLQLSAAFDLFLQTVPFDRLRFTRQLPHPVGVVVSPRNNSAIPWCNITLALLYAARGYPVTIIWDDLPFLDPEWNQQHSHVADKLNRISRASPIPVLKLSELPTASLDQEDRLAIDRLALGNAIWNVRDIVPSEKLDEYEALSHRTMLDNAPRIKALYQNHRFDHGVHQSVVNNNGCLHHWFATKQGTRMSCLDFSLGGGLVGTNDSPAYYADLTSLLDRTSSTYLFADRFTKKLAIRLAKKSFSNCTVGRDRLGAQVVPLDDAVSLPAFDVLIPLNIFWDASALNKIDMFGTPYHWIKQTLSFILDNTQAKVAVRQHPHERLFENFTTGKLLAEDLAQEFGNNPRYQFYAATDPVNTYALLRQTQVVLPFTSTLGIEAALLGKRVILASDVYYSNQPFVKKSHSKQEYFTAIAEALDPQAPWPPLAAEDRDDAWLLYFLLVNCTCIFTDFGLDPRDVKKWTAQGFNALMRDTNLLDAIEASATNTPYAHFSAKKILADLAERDTTVIALPEAGQTDIANRLAAIVKAINQQRFDDARAKLAKAPEPDHLAYAYLLALLNAKQGNVAQARRQLSRLLEQKPNHPTGNMLMKQLQRSSP